MHRLITLGPRVGFALLVGALVAFEGLFVAEMRAGAASLEAERVLRSARASEALEVELVRGLDVAEARIEALETLPLLEEDGLLWVRAGMQVLPRVAGVAPVTEADQRVVEAIDAWLGGDPAALGRIEQETTSPLSLTLSPVGGEGNRVVLRAWPWLSRKTAAAWCVRVQRGDPKDTAFVAACQRGLQGQRVDVTPTDTPSLQGAWLVVRRGADVRGVEVQVKALINQLEEQLRKRATLELGDSVALVDGAPLPTLRLISPRLDHSEVALRSALTWKTVLLALTGLLGLGVVLLARLAESRRGETLALQRDFIATVSHELRTPLAAIRVMAETLERKLPTDGPAKDYPRRLVAAADGLTFLVDNILSFNRIESGRLTPKKASFVFSALEPLLREDAQLAVDTGVEVQCEGLATLPVVSADAELMRVLVLNLLRNAWKYAQRRPVTFRVTGGVEAGTVVLRFTDNGPGIPQEAHERVFEAFHRLPTATHTGGSGLGLALARRVAELHGGALRISGSSEAGTTFELRLPVTGTR